VRGMRGRLASGSGLTRDGRSAAALYNALMSSPDWPPRSTRANTVVGMVALGGIAAILLLAGTGAVFSAWHFWTRPNPSAPAHESAVLGWFALAAGAVLLVCGEFLAFVVIRVVIRARRNEPLLGKDDFVAPRGDRPPGDEDPTPNLPREERTESLYDLFTN